MAPFDSKALLKEAHKIMSSPGTEDLFKEAKKLLSPPMSAGSTDIGSSADSIEDRTLEDDPLCGILGALGPYPTGPASTGMLPAPMIQAPMGVASPPRSCLKGRGKKCKADRVSFSKNLVEAVEFTAEHQLYPLHHHCFYFGYRFREGDEVFVNIKQAWVKGTVISYLSSPKRSKGPDPPPGKWIPAGAVQVQLGSSSKWIMPEMIGIELQKQVKKPFAVGERVHCWKNSHNAWYTSGAVRQILSAPVRHEGVLLPKGSIFVECNTGDERAHFGKWVHADLVGIDLQRPCKEEERRFQGKRLDPCRLRQVLTNWEKTYRLPSHRPVKDHHVTPRSQGGLRAAASSSATGGWLSESFNDVISDLRGAATAFQNMFK